MNEVIEKVARAIALADREDYMEDYARFDRRAEAAVGAIKDALEDAWDDGHVDSVGQAVTWLMRPRPPRAHLG